MKVKDIYSGQIVYHDSAGRRVTVLWVDAQTEYVHVEDNEGNIYDVHASRLKPVISDNDMDSDDILEREG